MRPSPEAVTPDYVIEALASDRSDGLSDVGVRSAMGARRRQNFLNTDGFHIIEHMITRGEDSETARPRGRRRETVARSRRPWMLRDGDTNDGPAIMSEQHQDEQESASADPSDGGSFPSRGDATRADAKR